MFYYKSEKNELNRVFPKNKPLNSRNPSFLFSHPLIHDLHPSSPIFNQSTGFHRERRGIEGIISNGVEADQRDPEEVVTVKLPTCRSSIPVPSLRWNRALCSSRVAFLQVTNRATYNAHFEFSFSLIKISSREA